MGFFFKLHRTKAFQLQTNKIQVSYDYKLIFVSHKVSDSGNIRQGVQFMERVSVDPSSLWEVATVELAFKEFLRKILLFLLWPSGFLKTHSWLSYPKRCFVFFLGVFLTSESNSFILIWLSELETCLGSQLPKRLRHEDCLDWGQTGLLSERWS